MLARILFSGIFLLSSLARAEELSFPTVWKQISNKSPALKAAKLENEAALETKDRASRHWLPRIYLDARGFQTNDPGTSFISLLEQRSLTQADFNTDSINHPDSHFYTRGTLGADLPLFEGGMKTASSRMQTHLAAAKAQEMDLVKTEQYAETAKAYGSIAVLLAQQKKLADLDRTIERLLKSYQLGNKSNPVGYSGLLGLKSLSNRLQGLLQQYTSQREAFYSALKEMGLDASSNWKPRFENSLQYADQFLFHESSPKEGSSSRILAIKENALAAQEASGIEKAKYLPRVGAFAETYAYQGNRDTANAYTAGLYLQWNLFDPSAYGSLKETQLHAKASENQAQALAQRERAEFQALKKLSETLRANIHLLDESQKLMSEQSQVTETLFKNGSVNALQFVEVLSRRADLIDSQTEAHLGLIKTSAEMTVKTQFVIPIETEGGTL